MLNKPQEKYPFSQGTIEGDHLKGVTGELRNAIMDVTGIYDEANSINEIVSILQSNHLRTQVRGVTSEVGNAITDTTGIYNEANSINKIENILQSNHPRSQALYDYVVSSEENEQWYLENTENIKLVEDGIEILGDIFCLEDEKALDGEGIANDSGYTYFNFDSAQKHAKSQGKRVPSKDDWEKYTDFLPGSDENKVKFLTQVLGLSFAGTRFWNNAYYYNQSTNAYYWSSTPNSTVAYNMVFSASNIYPAINNTRGYAFSLRCLKN